MIAAIKGVTKLLGWLYKPKIEETVHPKVFGCHSIKSTIEKLSFAALNFGLFEKHT